MKVLIVWEGYSVIINKTKKTPIIIIIIIYNVTSAIGPQVWKFPNHLYQILLTNGFFKNTKNVFKFLYNF